ncbi:alanine--tRNA ligase-related protein, partial [Blautia wexlerae]|nr:alanine--tRNA ligase-related protein [Blautia wexlerae]
AYPELEEKRAMILKLINVEEESFAKTIDQGLQILNNLIENHSGEVLSGEDAFRLNDTYGFPLDLTKEIVAERGISVDEERFHELMQEQRERARNARKNAGADAWAGENDILADIPETKFLGYELASTPATVLAILKDGERVDSATAGDEIALILDQTTFYAESGGQVGDVGPISSENALIAVDQTTKNH